LCDCQHECSRHSIPWLSN